MRSHGYQDIALEQQNTLAWPQYASKATTELSTSSQREQSSQNTTQTSPQNQAVLLVLQQLFRCILKKLGLDFFGLALEVSIHSNDFNNQKNIAKVILKKILKYTTILPTSFCLYGIYILCRKPLQSG